MKAAIFDMDGTLLDSMHMWNKLLPMFLNEYNIEADEKFMADTHSLSLDQMVPYVVERYSLPISEEELRSHWKDVLSKCYKEEVVPKDGIAELLESLKAHGFKTCVATLTDHQLCDKALKDHGLYKYFDHVLTTEDVNMVGKEQPDLFLKCASLMGSEPSETVVFEDSLYPVLPAKKAGFKVCIIEEPVMAAKKEQLMALSDKYIKSFVELL